MENVVYPDNLDIYTQKTEAMSMRAKRKLRFLHGTWQNLFSKYLSEFVCRQRFRNNIFGNVYCLVISTVRKYIFP